MHHAIALAEPTSDRRQSSRAGSRASRRRCASSGPRRMPRTSATVSSNGSIRRIQAERARPRRRRYILARGRAHGGVAQAARRGEGHRRVRPAAPQARPPAPRWSWRPRNRDFKRPGSARRTATDCAQTQQRPGTPPRRPQLAQASAALGDRTTALREPQGGRAGSCPIDAAAAVERARVRALVDYFTRDFRSAALHARRPSRWAASRALPTRGWSTSTSAEPRVP